MSPEIIPPFGHILRTFEKDIDIHKLFTHSIIKTYSSLCHEFIPAAVIAPTLIPENISHYVSSTGRFSTKAAITPASYAPKSPPAERMRALHLFWLA